MKKLVPQSKLFQLHPKQKTVYLMDHSLIAGEFRAYYKPHPYLVYKEEIITSSFELNEFLKPIYDDCIEDAEQFVVIFLSRSNKIIHYTIISTGGITGTVVDVQIILRHAILLNAKNLVLSHNHPSGNLKPSDADISITKRLRDAAKLFEINTLDHLILSKNGFYSFADEGII